jgi:hypothetical protein
MGRAAREGDVERKGRGFMSTLRCRQKRTKEVEDRLAGMKKRRCCALLWRMMEFGDRINLIRWHPKLPQKQLNACSSTKQSNLCLRMSLSPSLHVHDGRAARQTRCRMVFPRQV